MKIDLHTHMLPAGWPDLAERYGYGEWPRITFDSPSCARMFVGDRPFRDIDDRCWNASRRLEECDAHGVDMQVLSTVPVMFAYWARAEHTLALAEILNDHLAEQVRAHPTRFSALGTVPLQDADLAIRELERCVRDLGMPGVQIGTHVNGLNLDEPAMFAFLEAASDLGAAVFVHPWDMLAKDRMPRYFLPWLVGMPAETALAMTSLIFGGVLERLPRLRIGFAHGGGATPGTIGRIDHGYHARPDLCALNISRPPSTYLRQCYVDSLVHDPQVLQHLLDLFGVERVALGTDFPFPLGELAPGALIESIEGFTPEVRARLLGGTALEFLGLTRSAPAPVGG